MVVGRATTQRGGGSGREGEGEVGFRKGEGEDLIEEGEGDGYERREIQRN